jgi:Ser/Thr protein kinase RdoA (MazF antagonist)
MIDVDLINRINSEYHVNIEHVEPHREMIGKVYILHNSYNKYVLKVFRNFKTQDALQTVQILDYLNANSYPSVSIIRTKQNDSHIIFNQHDTWCVGILYDFVDGITPDGIVEAESIAKQIGELHNLMAGYPHDLMSRTKNEYIDDYITIMRDLDFEPTKILELEQYGNELWQRITMLPKSFSHGDLHTGNMIKNNRGEYVLLDFDEASGDYPSMDVAYMSDDTNFNQLHISMYDKSMRLYERFYSGYSKVRSMSDNEFKSVFDFIAIRHFQIISRIVRCQGLQCISKKFCEEQYGWLTQWKDLCLKKQL